MSLAAQIREWVAEAAAAVLEQFDKRLSDLDDRVKELEAKVKDLESGSAAKVVPPTSRAASLTDKPPAKSAASRPSK